MRRAPSGPQPKSTAELFVDLCAPLVPPQLMDMRKRCAVAAAANGAPSKAVEAILAVALFVDPKQGSAE